jgi:hypothetical protein
LYEYSDVGAALAEVLKGDRLDIDIGIRARAVTRRLASVFSCFILDHLLVSVELSLVLVDPLSRQAMLPDLSNTMATAA